MTGLLRDGDGSGIGFEAGKKESHNFNRRQSEKSKRAMR